MLLHEPCCTSDTRPLASGFCFAVSSPFSIGPEGNLVHGCLPATFLNVMQRQLMQETQYLRWRPGGNEVQFKSLKHHGR
jgi:hypothetical protein